MRHTWISAVTLAAISNVCLAAAEGAQATQDHPGQYSQAEIDAGTRVYNSQCSQCHGPNGDQVTGIDLRRAQFRRAATDEDLAQVITKGVMPDRDAAVCTAASGTDRRDRLHPRRFRQQRRRQDRQRHTRARDLRGQRCLRVPVTGSTDKVRAPLPISATSEWRARRRRCSEPCWTRPRQCSPSTGRCAS